MKDFPPNTEPRLFAFTAAIAGALVVDGFDYYELGSIANWIILFGQYILTYASQLELIEQRLGRSTSGNIGPNNNQNQENKDEIDNLIRAVNILQNELAKIKNEK